MPCPSGRVGSTPTSGTGLQPKPARRGATNPGRGRIRHLGCLSRLMVEEFTHGPPRRGPDVWRLARLQHGVVTRAQLHEHGYGDSAIYHRVERGRLHRVHRGVFAVGRPNLSQRGRWNAAVLAAGAGALLSHGSAAQLWGIRAARAGRIEVSISHRGVKTGSGRHPSSPPLPGRTGPPGSSRHPGHEPDPDADRSGIEPAPLAARGRCERSRQARPARSRAPPRGPGRDDRPARGCGASHAP
jgi:Transcriptional regulator, AbiEi antitoxin